MSGPLDGSWRRGKLLKRQGPRVCRVIGLHRGGNRGIMGNAVPRTERSMDTRQMEMGEKGGYLARCLLVKHHGGAFPGKISRGNLDLLIIVAIDAYAA